MNQEGYAYCTLYKLNTAGMIRAVFQHAISSVTSDWVSITHLSQGTFGHAQFRNNPQRDADHRGERQQPAESVTPPRVHILVIILQRSVFDQGECKRTLPRQAAEEIRLERLTVKLKWIKIFRKGEFLKMHQQTKSFASWHIHTSRCHYKDQELCTWATFVRFI